MLRKSLVLNVEWLTLVSKKKAVEFRCHLMWNKYEDNEVRKSNSNEKAETMLQFL